MNKNFKIIGINDDKHVLNVPFIVKDKFEIYLVYEDMDIHVFRLISLIKGIEMNEDYSDFTEIFNSGYELLNAELIIKEI